MSFAIGENVGPYRILEQLGQGGMATVYKGYHAALDRYVAIKVLHPAFLQDPNFQARFQREAKVVARLEHPNIVPIYDYAEHAGQPYLVMKFIEGSTLKARLGQGPLGKEEGLNIVEASGGALAYAHKRGVLHRDIKPSNILLAPDNAIYLADFGLARMAQAGESTLTNDMMLGTPQYISPEQARGDRNLDEGTDIYSFGVVLYEMVVGKVPFSADTPFSIIHDHIYKPLPLPHSINPRVPEVVERVLLKALAKERVDRYQSVDEMVEAFGRAVRGQAPSEPVAAAATFETLVGMAPGPAAGAGGQPQGPMEASSTTGAAEPPKKKRRWMWVVGGIVLMCLCGFVFLALTQNGSGQDPSPEVTPAVLVDVSTPPQEPRPVLEARQRVADNPNDPAAHLALAEALLGAKADRLALEEYLKATELFLGLQDNLEASNSGLQALALAGGPGNAPPRVLEPVTQALFLSAAGEPAILLLGALNEQYPDWALLPVLRARLATSKGEVDQARQWLDQALTDEPGNVLASAARAEWEFVAGDAEKGRRLADQIMAETRLPWLKEFLAALLAKPQ
jgi:tRNA A-37 threonylcarbamoyl transferase component Bud32